jgi:response regulator RpfG family c-di-GMP phosphodiesterase
MTPLHDPAVANGEECPSGAQTSCAPEERPKEARRWKVLIADDEAEVHGMTRMVLADFAFEGRRLEFLSAYSGAETLRVLARHPDTALILLDVVMETDDAGLKVVGRIREELANPFVRIVLRTGQPGKAPENQVIARYDINDYKEKTELTAQKLFTTVTASLRSYRDLRIIEQNRRGLEKIIEASANLFEMQSLCQLAQGVLMQLTALLQLDASSAILMGAGFAASRKSSAFVIMAGTGKYAALEGRRVQDAVTPAVMAHLDRAVSQRRSLFLDDRFVGFFSTQSGASHLLYLRGCRRLTELDRKLIGIFSSNVAAAFENVTLNQEIIDTQKEMILTLGEVIESRSKETGHHVRRVAEASHLLARKAGLSPRQADLLRMASPMHDVGKVGIPDAVLLKPGSLTPEEFAIVKHHTEIGYQILKSSRREILEAAVIAARQHHEWWDGSGYPLGLKGEQIHLFGRITSIADVFDALLHPRVYKAAWEPGQVLDYLRQRRGTQFDPRLVDLLLENSDAFLAIIRRYPDEPVVDAPA